MPPRQVCGRVWLANVILCPMAGLACDPGSVRQGDFHAEMRRVFRREVSHFTGMAFGSGMQATACNLQGPPRPRDDEFVAPAALAMPGDPGARPFQPVGPGEGGDGLAWSGFRMPGAPKRWMAWFSALMQKSASSVVELRRARTVRTVAPVGPRKPPRGSMATARSAILACRPRSVASAISAATALPPRSKMPAAPDSRACFHGGIIVGSASQATASSGTKKALPSPKPRDRLRRPRPAPTPPAYPSAPHAPPHSLGKSSPGPCSDPPHP